MASDTTAEDPLLRTGDAAALLGVSRQHVVNLCDRGELPCESVGTHRRLRRSDVLAYARRGTALTRDQARSLWLHHAVAGKLVAHPDRCLAVARRNLRNLLSIHPRGQARLWLTEWSRLLEGPVADIADVLTSRSQRSVELRQNSPFAGVLSEAERSRVLQAFVETSRRHEARRA
jgi:excisionase family DNA binding protein